MGISNNSPKFQVIDFIRKLASSKSFMIQEKCIIPNATRSIYSPHQGFRSSEHVVAPSSHQHVAQIAEQQGLHRVALSILSAQLI